MISAYEKGMDLIEIGDYFAASKKFLRLKFYYHNHNGHLNQF